ncbi:MAG: hypothetical protein DCC67_14280 [Planctomycetota bacterium]|nr:MAG: hypothetical protein DCC67_14280 [Planctomycetota bacterium]
MLTAHDELELASDPLNGCGDALLLRRQGSAEVQTFRLRPGKFTVGSSPQCQICLPDPGVKPLQCLVAMEPGGAVAATRWAAGVRLNGGDFTKTTLGDGDILTIGSWTIEFAAADPSLPADDDDEPAASDDDAPAISALPGDPLPAAETPHQPSGWPSAGDAGIAGASSASAAGVNGWAFDPGPPPAEQPAPQAPACGSSHDFADGLILQLWQASSLARRRAKALMTAVRAARSDAAARAADFAALSTELNLVRAAFEAQADHDDHQQDEIARQRQLADDRIASLVAELNAARSEIAATQSRLDAQAASSEELTAALASLERLELQRQDDRQQHEAVCARLEASLAQLGAENERLATTLEAVVQERDRLSELHHVQRERVAELEQAVLALQQAASATGCEGQQSPPPAPDQFRSAAIENQFEAPIAQTAVLGGGESPCPADAAWPASVQPWSDGESTLSPGDQQPLSESRWNAAPSGAEVKPSPQPAAGLAAPDASTDGAGDFAPPVDEVWPALDPGAEIPSVEQPTAAATQQIAEYAAPSFIDKYRHLLEEEGDRPAETQLPRSGRLELEEEFLSPAKARPCASPCDDSDEALEAYMASLMKRLTGAPAPGPSFAAPSKPGVPLEPASLGGSAGPVAPSAVGGTGLDVEISGPDQLRQTSRKTLQASELSVLREIANDSARTAIANHSERRQYESALSRIVVAFTATLSSAYLMASAPALSNPQFWGGVVAGVVGVTAAVQVIQLERRRQSDRRAMTASSPFGQE